VPIEGREDAEVGALIPFQQIIIGFEESRRRMETVDSQKSSNCEPGWVTPPLNSVFSSWTQMSADERFWKENLRE
jgi:hypothetical protein